MMNERGFTLVEIIIALTILALLFTVIAYIQAAGAASYTVTSQRVEVQESLRIALKKMGSELKGGSSSSVSIIDDGQTIIFESASGTSGYRYDARDKELETYVNGVWLPFASNIEDVLFLYDTDLHLVTIKVRGERERSGSYEVEIGVFLRVL